MIWALERGAVAFRQKSLYAADVDRGRHAICGLKIPMLADIASVSRDTLAQTIGSKT